MSVHLGHLRTTAAALVVGLLFPLAGCNEDAGPGDAALGARAPATASPTEEGDPLAGAPALDACYRMSMATAQARTNTSNPVSSCYDDHTTVTYYVGAFPDDAAAADDAQMIKDCTARLPEAMGLTRKQLASSVFDFVFFEPTTSQWSAGARWFRCDATAETGGRLKLMPPGSTPILSGGKVENAYLRCVDDRSGSGDYVTCNRPHTYRWAGVFTVKGTAKYPKRAFFEKQGKGCYKFTDNGAYWVTWPLEPQWDAGDRQMNCYRKTTS
jgi:hypothetical protein